MSVEGGNARQAARRRTTDGMPRGSTEPSASRGGLSSQNCSYFKNICEQGIYFLLLPPLADRLQLLCIEYAGFRIIDPSVDVGLDIATEYEEAARG